MTLTRRRGNQKNSLFLGYFSFLYHLFEHACYFAVFSDRPLARHSAQPNWISLSRKLSCFFISISQVDLLNTSIGFSPYSTDLLKNDVQALKNIGLTVFKNRSNLKKNKPYELIVTNPLCVLAILPFVLG
jgi:hypothetical protein